MINNYLIKSTASSASPSPSRRDSPPTAPPMEYNDDVDFPIAVAIPVPPPSTTTSPTLTNRDEEVPQPAAAASAAAANSTTTTTTIDRSTNARDGSLSLSVSTTIHYPNGHRERKIEYYRIPRNVAKQVSAALDNGQMPSTTYLIRMEQQSLPPGTADLPIHPPTATTTTTTTAAMASSGGGHRRTHLGSDGRKCGICWCTTCTLCIGTFFVIGVILVVVFVIQPWSKVMHSSSLLPAWHDVTNANNNNNNDYHDGSANEWMTPYPAASPSP